MSEIVNTYHLDIEANPGILVFDSLDALLDVLKSEVETSMSCLGSELTIVVRQGEMERSQFEQLTEMPDC